MDRGNNEYKNSGISNLSSLTVMKMFRNGLWALATNLLSLYCFDLDVLGSNYVTVGHFSDQHPLIDCGFFLEFFLLSKKPGHFVYKILWCSFLDRSVFYLSLNSYLHEILFTQVSAFRSKRTLLTPSKRREQKTIRTKNICSYERLCMKSCDMLPIGENLT